MNTLRITIQVESQKGSYKKTFEKEFDDATVLATPFAELYQSVIKIADEYMADKNATYYVWDAKIINTTNANETV
jgi:hypothetical protein